MIGPEDRPSSCRPARMIVAVHLVLHMFCICNIVNGEAFTRARRRAETLMSSEAGVISPFVEELELPSLVAGSYSWIRMASPIPLTEAVDAWRLRGCESIDGGHRFHSADEQRQPLPGHRIGPNKVLRRVEVQYPGGLCDAVCRQVVSLARRQVGGVVDHPPDDAVCRQVAQSSVDRGVWLAQNERQLRRVNERRPAEGVENLPV